jgi:hypothetical protein
MDAAELREFLDTGVAMLGASADAQLKPEAFRVWSATIDDGGTLRALVTSDAARTLRSAHDGTWICFVFTDITTFRSVQVKGTMRGEPQPAGPADAARMRRYDERFGAALEAVGHPSRLGVRLHPAAVFAVSVTVERLYDQTPGPTAGTPLGAGHA